MKLNTLFVILKVVLNAPHSCSATILVKFGQVHAHYLERVKKGFPEYDPLDNFELHSRQLLCEAAINAKQFMLKHHAQKYCERKLINGVPKVKLVGWSALENSSKDALNLQRRLSSPSNPDPSTLAYRKRWTRVGAKHHEQVKSLPCVHTANVKWFLTFGFTDHFMYLLEAGNCQKNKYLLVTGLFEPSALIRDKPESYLHSQLVIARSKFRMQSAVCEMGAADMLRTCSAIFDALNKDDLVQINHVKKDRRDCALRRLEVRGCSHSVKVLKCLIVQDETELRPFYALADISEEGAVFVLTDGKRNEILLKTRVAKIGALLYPAAANNVKLKVAPKIKMRVKTNRKKKDEESESCNTSPTSSGSTEEYEGEEIGDSELSTNEDEGGGGGEEEEEKEKEEGSNLLELYEGGEGSERSDSGLIVLHEEYAERENIELELYQAPSNSIGAMMHEEYLRDLNILNKSTRNVVTDQECENRPTGQQTPIKRRGKRSRRKRNPIKWQKL